MPMTVKEQAKQAGVSERLMYMTRELARSGRADLIGAVQRGDMTVHRALVLAGRRRPKTGLERLISAWNTAGDDDRLSFIGMLKADAAR